MCRSTVYHPSSVLISSITQPLTQRMAEQQQQEYHDRANGWPPARQPPLNPSGGLDVFIVERHISQVPMRDDPQERVTIDSVSNSRAATNSVWPCESMRDTHESIREVNGRQYNAQNTTYFLPAGESTNFPSYSPPTLCTSNSHGCMINHYAPSSYA